MRVTISIETMHVRVSVAIMQVVLQCNKHMTISIVVMQVAISVVAMYVTASSSSQPFFIKLTRKHLKALRQVCISPLS